MSRQKQTKTASVKRYIYAVLILLSIYLSLVSFIDTSPAEQTLSSIGGENRLWFFAWGISTAFAIYLNSRYLAECLNFHNKFFNICLAIGSFAAFGPPTIMGDLTIQVVVHWVTGMMFGILSFLCVFTLLVVKYKKTGKGFIYIPLVLVIAAIDVAFIFAQGLTAMCEIVILVAVEATVFFINFIERAEATIAENEETLVSLIDDETTIVIDSSC